MRPSPAALRPGAPERVSLIDADPDLLRFLTDEDREAVGLVRLPVRTLATDGLDVQTQLSRAGAFGAIILDGLVAHEIQLSDRLGVRLLGPGDLIVWRHEPQPLILTSSRWHPASTVRMGLFGNQMLMAMQQWPALLAGLYLRMGQQVDRLSAQLMLCQLPRVEDRVLALMWLMAEPWGRVTAMGTRLSLDLTHELIGMMIGARRPTVTLALRELADRGAMIRQENSWLLLDQPGRDDRPWSGTAAAPMRRSTPSLTIVDAASRGSIEPRWSGKAAPDAFSSSAALSHAVVRLQAEHLDLTATFDQHVRTLRATRERCERIRIALAGNP